MRWPGRACRYYDPRSTQFANEVAKIGRRMLSRRASERSLGCENLDLHLGDHSLLQKVFFVH
jgi:hypothetical protein